MTSPLEQMDRLLADWSTKAAHIDQNLVDLTEDPVFGLVEKAPFEGVTAERVAPALVALEQVFVHRRLLEDVIDQAREIRATVSPLRHGRRLVEVERLLRDRSITLPPQPTPVTQRRLLDPEEVTRQVTPAELLEQMTTAYDAVRTLVAEVGTAWDELTPKVDRAEAELAELDGPSDAAGTGARAQFSQVGDAIAAARHLVAADPLGAGPGAANVLAGNLAALRRRLATTIRAPGAAGGIAGSGPGTKGHVPQ
ncbi:MAG: hypothetical protein NVSMB12_15310 [Acidimicrobiales bacterium]